MITKKKARHFKPLHYSYLVIVEFNNLEDAYKFSTDLMANGYKYNLESKSYEKVYVKNDA